MQKYWEGLAYCHYKTYESTSLNISFKNPSCEDSANLESIGKMELRYWTSIITKPYVYIKPTHREPPFLIIIHEVLQAESIS